MFLLDIYTSELQKCSGKLDRHPGKTWNLGYGDRVETLERDSPEQKRLTRGSRKVAIFGLKVATNDAC